MISLLIAIIEIIIILAFTSIILTYLPSFVPQNYCSSDWINGWSRVFGNSVIRVLCTIFPDPALIVITVSIMAIAFIALKTYVKIDLS